MQDNDTVRTTKRAIERATFNLIVVQLVIWKSIYDSLHKKLIKNNKDDDV